MSVVDRSARQFQAANGVPTTRLSGVVLSVARNAQIYGEKEPADYFYRVVSGSIRSYKIHLDGRRQIADFYFPGDMFGVEGGEEHAFSADALADTRILAIKRSVALSRAGVDHEIAHELWTLTLQEIDRAQSHTMLLIQRASERVAGFLLDMAGRMRTPDELYLPMTRQDIADYLGLSIETVSRQLTQLEKTSAIALTTSKRVTLRDRAALQRLNA